MKTITLPAHNRPDYLKQTIDSLKQLDLNDFTLFVNLEPNCQENIDLINGIDFVKVDLKINDKKLGVRGNPFDLLDRTFAAGSTWNYHIEDDMIFSKDVISLVNWYEQNQKENVIIYGTCNRTLKKEKENNNIIVTNCEAFSGLGWCISNTTWYKYLKNIWFYKSPSGPYHGEGWDWNITRLIESNNLCEAIPIVSRSNTIGEYGTYSTPYTHRIFKHLIMSDGSSTDYIWR